MLVSFRQLSLTKAINVGDTRKGSHPGLIRFPKETQLLHKKMHQLADMRT